MGLVADFPALMANARLGGEAALTLLQHNGAWLSEAGVATITVLPVLYYNRHQLISFFKTVLRTQTTPEGFDPDKGGVSASLPARPIKTTLIGGKEFAVYSSELKDWVKDLFADVASDTPPLSILSGILSLGQNFTALRAFWKMVLRKPQSEFLDRVRFGLAECDSVSLRYPRVRERASETTTTRSTNLHGSRPVFFGGQGGATIFGGAGNDTIPVRSSDIAIDPADDYILYGADNELWPQRLNQMVLTAGRALVSKLPTFSSASLALA